MGRKATTSYAHAAPREDSGGPLHGLALVPQRAPEIGRQRALHHRCVDLT